MTIRSFASTQRLTNRSAKCRFRRTLVIVHLALFFRNLACGQSKFRGRFGNCALHEQIVILFPSCKVRPKEQESRLRE